MTRRVRQRGSLCLQRPERGPYLGREQFRFLPGGEVATAVDLVDVREVGVGRSAQLRGAVQSPPGNVVKPTGTATGGGALPAALAAATNRPNSLPSGSGGAGAGQPVQRDVVDDAFAGEFAYGLPSMYALDILYARARRCAQRR